MLPIEDYCVHSFHFDFSFSFIFPFSLFPLFLFRISSLYLGLIFGPWDWFLLFPPIQDRRTRSVRGSACQNNGIDQHCRSEKWVEC